MRTLASAMWSVLLLQCLTPIGSEAESLDNLQAIVSVAESATVRRISLLPAAEAIQIVTKLRERKIPVTSGMEVGLQLADTGQSCEVGAFQLLREKERLLISSALKTVQGSKERYLIILDTGWPTFHEQESSLRSLRRVFDSVRSAIRIRESDLSAFDSQLDPADFNELNHKHACMIMRSLVEFRTLDERELINVLFMPLRPGQFRSKELFREIIELNQVMNMLGSDMFARTPSRAEFSAAKAFSGIAMSQVKALTTPWSASDDVVRIYEPLVSGLIRIFDTYSRIDPIAVSGHTVVDSKLWVSLSWNLTKFAAPPVLPVSSGYMIFAAAGNDNSDFVRGQRLFASEAMNNRRVVAVMNSHESSGAVTCSSATFDGVWKTEHTDKTIVSFPGRLAVESNAPCPGPGGGTSISTPRMAWLSALAELVHAPEGGAWISEMSSRVARSRSKIEGDTASAPVNIDDLILIREGPSND